MHDKEFLNASKQDMCWAPCLILSKAWRVITSREILENNLRLKGILDEPPCWSSMKISDNKRMIKRKGKLKRTLGEALQWLDEALKWYNWNNLELQKEKMNNLEQRIWYHEQTPEEGINHLDETRINYVMPILHQFKLMAINRFCILLIPVERIKRDIAQTSEGIDGTTGGIWKQRMNYYDNKKENSWTNHRKNWKWK